ncbi:protein phosphatase regulator [Emydomyces testavorans]|uniref:Protein phosphatase regulator n=1 Tax=Emydomyces testavorans TaxID=2070801 RepID=A0AAF0DH35_9EURO|nr:protein phosphatase regulator [Emydomyces testavorans]
MADVLAPPYRHFRQISPDSRHGDHSQIYSSRTRFGHASRKLQSVPVTRINSFPYCTTRNSWIPNASSASSQVSISRECPVPKRSLLDYEPHPDDGPLTLPDYDAGCYSTQTNKMPNEPTFSPQSSPGEDDGDRSSVPLNMPRPPGDDSCIERAPTRQVDYLTHSWKQEEIWRSWRYITRNQDSYRNGDRLENAVWRSWLKTKYRLKTVTPESLNWLKDADVTWLFGPLQVDDDCCPSNRPSSPIDSPTSSSFLKTKPILKKTGTPQPILQHSISTSSLLQKASSRFRPQNGNCRSGFGRTASDTVVPAAHLASSLRHEKTKSTTASGMTCSSSRRHISFNRVVAQVVAVGSEDDDDENEEENYDFSGEYCLLDDDDSSDTTLVTMKQLRPRPSLSSSSTPRSSFSSDTRTIIAHLPPTTLKYDSDSEAEDEVRYLRWSKNRAPLARSGSTDRLFEEVSGEFASSEHLEYARYNSGSQLFGAIEDSFKLFGPSEHIKDVEPHSDGDRPEKSTPVDVATPSPRSTISRENTSSSVKYDDESQYLSSSGVFMPFVHGDEEVDENFEDGSSANPDLIGKVVNIVNTFRDIAHVLWNVGWRP